MDFIFGTIKFIIFIMFLFQMFVWFDALMDLIHNIIKSKKKKPVYPPCPVCMDPDKVRLDPSPSGPYCLHGVAQDFVRRLTPLSWVKDLRDWYKMLMNETRDFLKRVNETPLKSK